MAKEILIHGWTKAWKLHTVKFGAALALIPEVLWNLAQSLADVLPLLSSEVREYLPQNVRVALALVGLTVVVLRLWRQKNVDSHFKKPG